MKIQGFTLGEVLLALFLVTSLSFNLITQQTHLIGFLKRPIKNFYFENAEENEAERRVLRLRVSFL